MVKSRTTILERVLSIVLSLLMLFTMLPVSTVFAEDAVKDDAVVGDEIKDDLIDDDIEDDVIVEDEVVIENPKFTVTDFWYKAIEDVTVKCFKITDGESICIETLTPNTSGEVEFTKVAELLTDESCEFKFTFEMTGYKKHEEIIKSEDIKSGSYDKNIKLLKIISSNNITVMGKTVTYDGNPHSLIIECGDILAPDNTKLEAEIGYKSLGDENYSSEAPSYTDAGEYTIYYVVKVSGYKDFEASTTLKIKPKKITDFELKCINDKDNNNTYTGEPILLVDVPDVQPDDKVTYKINDEESENAYRTAAGTYEVVVIVDRGQNYEKLEMPPVNVTIKPADLFVDGIKIQALESVYTGDPQSVITSITGKEDYYELEYRLCTEKELSNLEGEWSKDIPTVVSAGQYIVQVKATKSNYNDKLVDVEKAPSAIQPYNVYIAKAEQTGFEIEELPYDSYTYGAEGKIIAKGGQSGGEIIYKVIQGEEYVTIEEKTGGFRVIGAGGTATISAILSGKNDYQDAYATVEIKTEKDAQRNFDFPDSDGTPDGTPENEPDDTYEFNYGQRNAVIFAEGGQSGEDIIYSIIDGEDIGDIVTVDDKCHITFRSGKKGEMKIKATRPGGENYREISDIATVKVVSNNFSDKVIVDECPATGWYTTDVSITPAEGYKISNSDAFDADWNDKITITTEGQNYPDDVYLIQEGTGYISDAISIKDNYDIKIDKTNPIAESITYSKSILDVVLEGITFGFYNAEMTVTVKAIDQVSGINHLGYKIGDGKEITINEFFGGESGKSATASFTIPPYLSRSKITLFAYDNAGRDNRDNPLTGDKNLVIDDVKPVVSVAYDNNKAYNGYYFKGSRTATITIKEENFFADCLERINPDTGKPYLIITVDGESYKPVFTDKGDFYEATVKFEEDGEHTFDIEYTDYSGNPNDGNTEVVYGDSVAPTAFTIDNTAPVIDIRYDDKNATESDKNTGYFKGERSITFKVTETNFKPDEFFELLINCKDVKGNKLNLEQIQAFVEDLKNISSWSKDGNEYTATLKIDADVIYDANYEIEMSCSDPAENEADKKTGKFCLDNTKPYCVNTKKNKIISYSTSILDTFLNSISFGFYNYDVEVTVNAYDKTAGIDSFDCFYEKEIDKSITRVEIPNDKIAFSTEDEEEGQLATASFTIPKQFRGYVSFTATDKSGMTSDMFKDTKCIVIDDEKPVVTVGYYDKAGNLVKVKNGDYYNYPLTAIISISEENFFEEKLYDTIPGTDKQYLTITVDERLDDKTEYTSTKVEPKFKKVGDLYQAEVKFEHSADYKFDVEFTDYSGNEAEEYKEDSFTIDEVDPELSVKFSEDGHGKGNQYKENRAAVITIKEHNFAAGDVKVEIIAENANGTEISANFTDENDNIIKDYKKYLTDKNNWISEGDDVYKATIIFSTEAAYTFNIKYTDLAGNKAKDVAEAKFIVDKTDPQGFIKIADWTKSIDGTDWTSFPEDSKDTRKFGPLSTNQQVTVEIGASDELSGVDNINYFRSDKILTLAQVEKYDKWSTVENTNNLKFTVKPDEQFVVYAKIFDKAGNYHYISSDGIILDKTLPSVEKIAPEIIINPETNKKSSEEIYNSNVNVGVKVVDPMENGTYSGLQSITYNIYNVNSAGVQTKTQEGTLFTFDKTAGKAFVNTYDKANCIIVDCKKNNSNNVVIEIIATDNAGNTKIEKKSIKIDITAPVIDIAYDNNNAKNINYFDDNRKATITINERNFRNEDVVITVTHIDDDGRETNTKVTPNFTEERNGNMPRYYVFNGEGRDGSEYCVYTMDYLYDKDGDYRFSIEYTDLATNKCEEINFAQGTASNTEYEFTIDKTAPVIRVSYDNNNAKNGNYYNTDRVATIVITEHNLNPADKSRINVTVNATDNGNKVTAPVETNWVTLGNTHTATITYNSDAFYTFDISVKDKVDNESVDYTPESFYIDKTAPSVSISKIVDESANNSKGDIGFVITATDTNFDSFVPVLTVTDITGVSKELEAGTIDSIANGKTFTVKNLASDGIYRIACNVVDKAGNAFTKVNLQRSNGSTYSEDRDGDDTLLTFSVNRDGSTYEINNETKELIGKYYIQNVTKDVVISEINADTLTEHRVTVNGKELAEENYYKVTQEGGNGSWNKYTYSINKEIFADEGEYKIVVSSKDKANNDAFSDIKDATLNFVVDRTAPVVTITGLSDDGRYQTDTQTVTLIPTDDGGALKSLTVRKIDKEGREIDEIINLANDEFIKKLEDGSGKITFDIQKGLYQNVQIICDDRSVDEEGNTNVCNMVISNVSVDANAFIVNFWANKPLRWIVIAVAIALVIFAIFFIIWKSKKKQNDRSESYSSR